MDNLTKSSLNFLTSSHLDRMAGIRVEKHDFFKIINSEKTLFLPVREGKNLLHKSDGTNPALLQKKELGSIEINRENTFLLGERDGLTYFVVDLDLCKNDITFKSYSQFMSLRESKLEKRNWTGSLLAYSNALVSWHRNNHFCGCCGSKTKASELGQSRHCINNDCLKPHYPRTDPAIIVVVTKDDKCLMARKAEWTKGIYSLVAGYVDHGESLEDTVVREVMEETGIKVKSVNYHSSQPWPFPHTLMVGFFAEAENCDIKIDPHELEDAQWFSRQQIIDGLENGAHKLPTPFSISRNLISDWFDSGDQGKLADYL